MIANALRIVVAASIFLSLCGCSSIYLHDSGVAKTTSDAQTTFTAFKGDTQIFDRESAYLNDLETVEQQTVLSSIEALRTRYILEFLNGDGDRNGVAIMQQEIDDELTLLVGRTDSENLIMQVQESRADAVREAKTQL